MLVPLTLSTATDDAVLITSAEIMNVVTAGLEGMRGRRRDVSGDQRRRDDGHLGSLLDVAKIGH